MPLQEGKNFEVNNPILNSPFNEPQKYWYLNEGCAPECRLGRRPAIVYRPRDQKKPWSTSDRTLKDSNDFKGGYELALVNIIRERIKEWRKQG